MTSSTHEATTESQPFDLVTMPAEDDAAKRKLRLVVVSSVALSFISFWRAAAIVLNDLASTCYYIGGISEQAIGKAAPWFVLAVMLFSYAVRAVYVESCTMFTRGGVYRVVKQAEVALFGNRLGGLTAKLSVSALMFDYILTGPISAVSAGQYLAGLAGNLLALPPFRIQFDAASHPDAVRLVAMLIAIGITLYFWRTNIIGIGESSAKAMRIMQLTTIMGVIVIVWTLVTIALRPETQHLPPFKPVLTPESSGWLAPFPKMLGLFGILIAFGHSLLAMSGEESLAQVNRELEAPKTKNLLRAGLVIFIYSLLLTSLISFFAVMIIPDAERIKETIVDGHVIRESAKYTDNLISGLVMHLSGPTGVKLALQGFVVFVGFLILAGAVNTSIVGSNGVLNRLAEDGVLSPWFLHPQKRFGTTHRLINLVAILQIVTIVASMGNIYTLGEAYAFGVIWSFVFKTMAMIVLRFVDRSPRTYEVPLNIRITKRDKRGSANPEDRIDLPVGILFIFLVLFGTALVNLLTKKVATIWGVAFTLGFLAVFIIGEQLSLRRRKGAHHEHLEQFNERITDTPTPESLGLVHANPILVAMRNPNSMHVLQKLLHDTETNERDIVVVTCKVLPPLTPGITPEELSLSDADREVLTRVVTLAEEAGRTVHPLVIPTNNPMYAIATAARSLSASEVVLGGSEKSSVDLQLEHFAVAWGMSAGATTRASTGGPDPTRTIRIRIIRANDEPEVVYDV